MKKLGLSALLAFAMVVPWLMPLIILPIATFLNEVMAFAGYLLLVLVIEYSVRDRRLSVEVKCLLGALGGLALVVAMQGAFGMVANADSVASGVFYLLCAGLCGYAGYKLSSDERLARWTRVAGWVWVTGALCAVAIALIQYFQIELHMVWVSQLAEEGRVIGNIRQTNHFATLLVMCAAFVSYMVQTRSLGRVPGLLLTGLLTVAILTTGSRSGLLGLAAVLVLSLFQKGQSKFDVALLLAWMVVAHFLMVFAAQHWGINYYGGARMVAVKEGINGLANSRMELWSNSLYLLKSAWLTGVGFSQFQFFYAFSDIPMELAITFNNAHNLFLQLAVEFGLPVTLVFVAALVRALWLWRPGAGGAIGQLTLGVFVAIGVHSLFEFPLWYSYFLLPFALAFGLLIGLSAPPQTANDRVAAEAAPPKNHVLIAAFVGLLVLAAAVVQYLPLAAIYGGGGDRDTLSERLDTARKSFAFSRWIHFSTLASNRLLDESPGNRKMLAPLYIKAAKFGLEEGFLYNMTIALIESGKIESAKRVVYALGLMQTPYIFKIKTYCDTHDGPGYKAVGDYISNPTPSPVSARNLGQE